MHKLAQYFLISVLFSFIISCNNDASEKLVEDYQLVAGDTAAIVAGDTAAIIFAGDTLWIPPKPVCHNGSGGWSLADFNGAVNGGDYYVILLTWFASY